MAVEPPWWLFLQKPFLVPSVPPEIDTYMCVFLILNYLSSIYISGNRRNRGTDGWNALMVADLLVPFSVPFRFKRRNGGTEFLPFIGFPAKNAGK